jgi:CheY-like chemotaxis protein/two-component sensor histidine kinase
VDGLLDIAKIETGSLKLYRDSLRIVPFLDHVVDMFKHQAAAKGIEFSREFASHLPDYVHADERRLGQILLNLLSNAIKYTEHGRVWLDVRYRNGIAEFEVGDTGIGIHPDEIERIFEPFERGHAAAAHNIPGTGLGLTITRLLAQLLGGEVTVSSTPGSGSLFRVRLLLTEASPHAQQECERSITGYAGARKTVLIVDDDRAHLDLVEQVLSPLGFTVFLAMNGPDCLDMAQRCHPDIVLLDLAMPGMTGWEVAARLRAEHNDELAILVVSADAHVLTGGRPSPMLHDDYLVKPVQLPDLFEKLQLLLDLEWVTEPADRAVAARGPDAEAFLG